jgi:hypothetical protein
VTCQLRDRPTSLIGGYTVVVDLAILRLMHKKGTVLLTKPSHLDMAVEDKTAMRGLQPGMHLKSKNTINLRVCIMVWPNFHSRYSPSYRKRKDIYMLRRPFMFS